MCELFDKAEVKFEGVWSPTNGQWYAVTVRVRWL